MLKYLYVLLNTFIFVSMYNVNRLKMSEENKTNSFNILYIIGSSALIISIVLLCVLFAQFIALDAELQQSQSEKEYYKEQLLKANDKLLMADSVIDRGTIYLPDLDTAWYPNRSK